MCSPPQSDCGCGFGLYPLVQGLLPRNTFLFIHWNTQHSSTSTKTVTTKTTTTKKWQKKALKKRRIGKLIAMVFFPARPRTQLPPRDWSLLMVGQTSVFRPTYTYSRIRRHCDIPSVPDPQFVPGRERARTKPVELTRSTSSSNQRNSEDHGNTDSIQSTSTTTARKRGEELPKRKLPVSKPSRRHDASYDN